MPRKARTHADKARTAFLRGTHHVSPHAAMLAGARTEEEWLALLDGKQAVYHIQNTRKARRAVQKRHPVRLEGGA